MADRNRRILVAVLGLAAVLLIGYAVGTAYFIARGDLEAGPFRLATVFANIIAGGLALWAAAVFARQRPKDK